MKRNRSGWGVTFAGLLMVVSGLVAMWSGWDMILLERGWSLFIAGSVAISGGVVTVALGRVIAQLAALAPHQAADAVTRAEKPRDQAEAHSASAPISAPPAPPAPMAAPPAPMAAPPAPMPAQVLAPRPPSAPAAAYTAPPPPPAPSHSPPPPSPYRMPPRPAARPPATPWLLQTSGAPDPAAEQEEEAELVEVDRYTAGDETYVMLSDGSVEVRNAEGSQRYPSLEALRAEAATRQS